MWVVKFLIFISCLSFMSAAQAKGPPAHAKGKAFGTVASANDPASRWQSVTVPSSARAVAVARGLRGRNGRCPASPEGAPPFCLPPGPPE
jgi:hypothetical protein